MGRVGVGWVGVGTGGKPWCDLQSPDIFSLVGKLETSDLSPPPLKSVLVEAATYIFLSLWFLGSYL